MLLVTIERGGRMERDKREDVLVYSMIDEDLILTEEDLRKIDQAKKDIREGRATRIA